jgi:RNA polymerase sigma-70 factor (ECF subfamily)
MTRSDEPAQGPDGVTSSAATSRSLLDRVKADEAEAWDRLIGLYAPFVYRCCRRWNLPDQEAADVFQEVFQAVATHIGSFRKERQGDSFRGWLRTITDNKVRDHFRRLGREPAGEGGTEAQRRLSAVPADSITVNDDPIDDRAERSLFRDALDLIRTEFEAHTWQAFWLTTVEGRAASDVAADLGMSPGAVRVAKSRVLRRLRQELGEL